MKLAGKNLETVILRFSELGKMQKLRHQQANRGV